MVCARPPYSGRLERPYPQCRALNFFSGRIDPTTEANCGNIPQKVLMVIGPLMPYCYCACNCRETCRLTAELFGHSLSEFFLVVALDRLETELMSLVFWRQIWQEKKTDSMKKQNSTKAAQWYNSIIA